MTPVALRRQQGMRGLLLLSLIHIFRGLVQNGAHPGVDGVARGKGLIQLHVANDVAQRGSGQVFDGVHGTLHAVSIQLGVRNLEIDDGVDLHGDVILGDHGLGREIRHLLLQRHLFSNPLNERHFEMQTHVPNRAECAKALHHIRLGLLNDDDAVSYTHLDVYKRQR